jgi:hypothetical protein
MSHVVSTETDGMAGQETLEMIMRAKKAKKLFLNLGKKLSYCKANLMLIGLNAKR